jgi:hypothetical protein
MLVRMQRGKELLYTVGWKCKLVQPLWKTVWSLLKKIRIICTMEYYSVIRNNDMGFEGKWIQMEDIMLSKVSQTHKDKGHMCSLIHGRQIQMINVYTKTSMLIYKLRCRTCIIE